MGVHRLIETRAGTALRWLAALAALGFYLAHDPAGAGTADRRLTAAAVQRAVLGIVSYSRWPGPPRDLRLCVVGGAAYAGDLLRSPMMVAGHSVLPGLASVQDPLLGRACDIVYSGALPPAQQDRLSAAIAGQPVLTITEGDPSCVAGAMFCLDTRGVPVAFAVNLDSIARGGVKVSPRVLLLGRRRTMP